MKARVTKRDRSRALAIVNAWLERTPTVDQLVALPLVHLFAQELAEERARTREA